MEIYYCKLNWINLDIYKKKKKKKNSTTSIKINKNENKKKSKYQLQNWIGNRDFIRITFNSTHNTLKIICLEL